jgi:hypothetical protein
MIPMFFIIVHSSQIISINGIDQVAKMQAIEMLVYEDHKLEFLMACSMVPYVGDFRNLYYRVYLNTMRLFHYWSIKIIWKISSKPCGYNNFMLTFVNNYTFFKIKVVTKPLSTLVPIVNRLFVKSKTYTIYNIHFTSNIIKFITCLLIVFVTLSLNAPF